ncbi:GntR family transcriptional regulator [Leifsonia shinshuensis]|uniref:GntR family transcriptional regulator n=1 Tax=Leifsonia shinshuensis TaxID=150026 RepID=A0A7G6YBC5_9MICO|nr:GntR family transcriptional regulator [Leifsonia shinshuensis]QNE35790.1 GntR family transcriptional regulator [Leifsonia shinshuensis]
MPVPRSPEKPVSPRELVRERVYAQLKEAILSGVLLPGERLDEAELRGWLGVSGTPIRQALHTLSLEGLVETAPQSHSAVIAPRPEEARDTLQTIGVLVTGATILTLPQLTGADRTRLAALALDVKTQHERGDIPAITTAAETYFGSIVQACPNPVYIDVVAQVGPSLSYHVTVTHRALDADLAGLGRDYAELSAALLDEDDARVIDVTKRIFLIGSVPPSAA